MSSPQYMPIYRYELRPKAGFSAPGLIFGTKTALDQDKGFAWRDQLELEHRTKHGFRAKDMSEAERERERSWREEYRQDGAVSTVSLSFEFCRITVALKNPNVMKDECKHRDWTTLLGGKIRDTASFTPWRLGRSEKTATEYAPLRITGPHGFTEPAVDYTLEEYRREWDICCDFADFECMRLAIAFYDGMNQPQGLFQDADHTGIYTIADLRKCVREGIPRRLSKPWKFGQAHKDNPWRALRYRMHLR